MARALGVLPFLSAAAHRRPEALIVRIIMIKFQNKNAKPPVTATADAKQPVANVEKPDVAAKTASAPEIIPPVADAKVVAQANAAETTQA